jgi:PKD repeat protein
MVRAFRTLTLVLTVAAAAACSVKNTPAPALAGPSELGLSLTMAATPDIITQDGASQAQVIVVARDPSGKAVPSLTVRLEITQGGQIVDYGVLSSKTIVTGSDGRGSATYTAPRPPVVSVDTGTIVTVLATPIGTNYANSDARSVDIRLVPPGVIIPPSDLVAGFTFSPSAPAELDSVIFTATPCTATVTTGCTSGSVTSYTWSFGDGGTATGQTASHRFPAGTYAVTLTIRDAAGRAVSTTQTVVVKAGSNPTAAFTTSPAGPLPGQAVFFNASASLASGNRNIIDYQWTFGDGASGGGVTVSHAFAAVGAYTVTLTVVDDAGRTGTASQSVTVGATGPGAPVAKFTYSPTAPTHLATTVVFNGSDSTSASPIESYVWDFGDYTGPAYGVSVPHQFAAAGTYVVRLTITDGAGRTATTTQSVTVS